MKQRCYNENNPDYKNYGGRGIKVCDVWIISYKLFEEWALLNGYQDGLTLDRKNPNWHYNQENCRWTTTEIQAINKRNIKIYEYNGQLLSLSQICRLNGLDKSKIWYRMQRIGMGLYEAISLGNKHKKPALRINTLKSKCAEMGVPYNAVKIRKYKYKINSDEAIKYYLR